MKYNNKYHFAKMCAFDWCKQVTEKVSEKDVATQFNSFIPKNNYYRKPCLRWIRKINKKLFVAIMADKTKCLNVL